jgi:hypothetical protein
MSGVAHDDSQPRLRAADDGAAPRGPAVYFFARSRLDSNGRLHAPLYLSAKVTNRRKNEKAPACILIWLLVAAAERTNPRGETEAEKSD